MFIVKLTIVCTNKHKVTINLMQKALNVRFKEVATF
jgi:hypothetical protein